MPTPNLENLETRVQHVTRLSSLPDIQGLILKY